MKVIKRLLVSLFIGVLGACTVSNIYRNNADPKAINEVIFFEPMNTICSLDFNNQVTYDDSLTSLSNRVLHNVVNGLKDSLKIKRIIELMDSTHFHKGLAYISKNSYQNGKLYEMDSVNVPYSMDSALKANNTRFGLVLITIGHVRSNYDEFKRRVARNEIRLKYDEIFPERYVSRVYAAI